MFVPLGGGLGPELLIPPPPPPPGMMPAGSSTPPSPLPKLEKARSEGDPGERKSGDTTPLDLSKSPDSQNNNRAESDTESETILPDRRQLPPLRRGSVKETLDDPLRAKTPARASLEIEAQLHFLKAKQLEFLKDQHQKQAQALAAAQVAAVAVQQKSRCEECNINFSKYQNYIAHKKYYCSAAASNAGGPGSNPTKSANQPSAVVGPPLPILSDHEDDKSSDDGKSQRKLSPPIASPALLMGLTSPTLKDRKEGTFLCYIYVYCFYIECGASKFMHFLRIFFFAFLVPIFVILL